ncbi:MAG: 6-bladed beta-propeller [Bacteroidota bacterium]|nr:6-bladed beta-propeller [Bacteroidota bacterium]
MNKNERYTLNKNFSQLGIAVVICFAILTGCKTQQSIDPKTIKINPEQFIPVNLDTLLSYSTILSLEYTQEALLSEGGNVVFSEDGYFISDLRKPLYHFGPSGNFVKQIGSIGKGPGEYVSSMEMVVIQDGFALIETRGSTKIFFYDHQGNFVKSNQIFEEKSADFAKHPKNGDYYFYCTLFPNLIHRVDKTTLKVTASFLKSDELPRGSSYTSLFVTCQGNLLLSRPFKQRIYEIEEDTALLKYKFDYGAQYPDLADMAIEERRDLINHGRTWIIHNILDNKLWIYLMIRHQDASGGESEIHHLIIRKSNHEVFRLPGSLKTMELFFPAGFWLDAKNILYIPISPAFLMNQSTWLRYFKEKGINFNPEGNWLIIKIPLGKVV